MRDQVEKSYFDPYANLAINRTRILSKIGSICIAASNHSRLEVERIAEEIVDNARKSREYGNLQKDDGGKNSEVCEP